MLRLLFIYLCLSVKFWLEVLWKTDRFFHTATGLEVYGRINTNYHDADALMQLQTEEVPECLCPNPQIIKSARWRVRRRRVKTSLTELPTNHCNTDADAVFCV